MSLSDVFPRMNSPPLVVAMGAAVVLGTPTLPLLSSSAAVLKVANATAFGLNLLATSVPGRLDDQVMQGKHLKEKGEAKEEDAISRDDRSSLFGHSLLRPAGWAFAIWGPIFLGETIFAGVPFLENALGSAAALTAALPRVTAPFSAACVLQSLWCASFRPSYGAGWSKFVSTGMLAGTAYSLSRVHAVACSGGVPSEAAWCFVPLTLHFGWTTAATLVDFNRKVATRDNAAVVGHVSALVGAAVGVSVTLLRHAPTYGLTLAWALGAVANEMGRKRSGDDEREERARWRQRILCLAGSLASVAASLFVATSSH